MNQRGLESATLSSGLAHSKKTRVVYSADFETTTDADDCRVWLWGLLPVAEAIKDSFEWGNTIESFLDRIADHNSMTYFHNLKHDGRFIIDWLLKNGYSHSENDKKSATAKGTFTTLISDMNKFYSITVRWLNGKSTEFRDSAKKFPMSLSNVAKAFKLEESKGEIDYHTYRPVGYMPDANELDYQYRDVEILADALLLTIEAGMTALTVGADSLNEYKRLIGSKYFRRRFPVLNDSMDSEIRRALRGGFTYADERFKSRKVGGGIVLDVNSLYPSVMYSEVLPYGLPSFKEGRVVPTEDRPLVIFSVTFTAKLKPKHIPCIQIKGSSLFGATEYLKEIKEPTTLMVTNIDWELYNEQYDITVQEYGGGWAFYGERGMFKNYIDKWSKIKAEASGGQREIAKLHLNSLFGKFGSNPNVTGKIPVLENNLVRLVRGKDATKSPIYTAMAVFITSYARALTIRAAQANYDTFAYADTDSLHLLGVPLPADADPEKPGLWEGEINTLCVHPTRMGAWKLEYSFTEAFYVKPKVYLELKGDDTYHVAWAGLPEGVSRSLTFDDLYSGNVIHGKLVPKAVPGGVVLEDTSYTLTL